MTGDSLAAIAETLLRELEERAAALGIRLSHTQDAVRLLAREGYDPATGARSLRRAVTRRVEQCLAEQMLAASEDAERSFLLDAPDGVLTLDQRAPQPATANG